MDIVYDSGRHTLLLIICLTILIPIHPVGSHDCAQVVTNDPIRISSDLDFMETALSEGWSGTGASSDPYVIENLEIITYEPPGTCISVENTTKHFVIRECNLSVEGWPGEFCVYLGNVTNGAITGCNMRTEYWAVYAFESENIHITDSLVYGEDACVVFEDSEYCFVSNSELSGHLGNGITFDNCNHSIVYWNLVNGTVMDSQDGIVVVGPTAWNFTILNNTIIGHYAYGIRLCALDCLVIGNKVLHNGVGIQLDGDSNNTLVIDNSFINNTNANAVDHGSNNVWVSNFYDDYNGWGQYQIPGNAGSVEYYSTS